MINKKVSRGFLAVAVMAALFIGSFTATFSEAGIKTWNATALTGGATRALDAIATASLTDGDRAISLVSGALYIHEYDSAATDAEASPDYIRPDDYATSGVWVQQTSPLDSTIAAGTIVGWFSTSPPTDFLECDGSAVSRTTYSDLFSEISDDFGAGDGSTTFNLPDLRGEFLRGWDHGAGTDPDAATRTDRGDTTTGDNIGTKQADEFKSHIHDADSNQVDGTTSGTFRIGSGTQQQNDTNATGGNETRPTNVNIMWCIKY